MGSATLTASFSSVAASLQRCLRHPMARQRGTRTLLFGQTPEPRMHQAESQSQVGSADDRGAALTPARNLGCAKNCASSAPGTAKAVAMARRTILVVVPLPSSLPLLSLSLLSSMVGGCARAGFVVTWQAACWASEGATSAVLELSWRAHTRSPSAAGWKVAWHGGRAGFGDWAPAALCKFINGVSFDHAQCPFPQPVREQQITERWHIHTINRCLT